MKFLVAACFFFSASLAAQDGIPTQPIKNFHTNKLLLPVCTKEELYRVRAATSSVTKNRNPAGAWAVAEAMLCGKAPRGNMPKLVAQDQYGVENDPGPVFALVPREKIEPLRGVAYGVTVDKSQSDIVFSYNTAGICVGGFTLRYVARDWLLVANGAACD